MSDANLVVLCDTYSLSFLSFILGAVWNRCSGGWWRWNAGNLVGENSLSVSLRSLRKGTKIQRWTSVDIITFVTDCVSKWGYKF